MNRTAVPWRSSRVAMAAALALFSGAAPAQPKAEPQSYPSRPIRIIVPNTAGSAMDAIARMIGQRLTESWGQPTVIDDRPGVHIRPAINQPARPSQLFPHQLLSVNGDFDVPNDFAIFFGDEETVAWPKHLFSQFVGAACPGRQFAHRFVKRLFVYEQLPRQ